MWDWDGSLPTMVGVLPRDGEAKDVRWFKGPARNTLHFLNATDRGNTVTLELPTSSGERDASQIRRWTFDLNSKSAAFQEDVVSTTPGFLPRMDDRYLSLDYRYAFISSRVANDADPKAAATQGHPAARRAQWARSNNARSKGRSRCRRAASCPRANSKSEGDGYVMTIASNFDTMSSDLIITDAQHLEDGVVATVKLPFRLRSGTHTNWYPQAVLPPIKDEPGMSSRRTFLSNGRHDHRGGRCARPGAWRTRRGGSRRLRSPCRWRWPSPRMATGTWMTSAVICRGTRTPIPYLHDTSAPDIAAFRRASG